MKDLDEKSSPALPDMSPEAIAARIRRVVELNRLCQSLAAAGREQGPPPDENREPGDNPRR
jgi:hypothetical protein